MMSANDPLTGGGLAEGGAVGVVGVEVLTVEALARVSIRGRTAAEVDFSWEGLGALRGGAAGRRLTVLDKPNAGFGLRCLSASLDGSPSAFRLMPLSGDGNGGRLGRVPDFVSLAEAPRGLALNGRTGGLGGVGAFPLPMELTMSPKKLILPE